MRVQAPASEAEGMLAKRMAAGLIDCAAILAAAALVCEAGALVAGRWMPAQADLEPFRGLLTILVFLIYHAVLASTGPEPGTFGQRLCGLALEGAGGGRPSRGEALARALALLCAALPAGAGFLLALTPRGRPFQDLLCASRVVRRRPTCAEAGAPLTRPAGGPT